MNRLPDVDAAQHAIRAFLEALGYDLNHPDLAETPARVVEAYLKDLVVGERVDVARLLDSGSIASHSDAIVVVRGIETMTMCPHHLLPAQGRATIAYLPGTRVLGLGTLAHLVDACSRRLALQERVGQDVIQALMNDLGARGAYCALSFDHCCLRLRGARQSGAKVETVHVGGLLGEQPHATQLANLLQYQGDQQPK